MGYRLENKDINLNEKKFTKIAQGKTGNIFKCNGYAIKVFNNYAEDIIDLETAKYLTGIRTNRIILPNKLLFYNNGFKGYSMKLVKKDPRQRKIINCPTDELIRNVEIIEEDIKILSDKKVLLNGINPENTTFNGKLYLTDPSKYRILDIESTEELEKLNNYQFYILLTNLIIKELNKSHISASTIQRMKELLSLKDDSIYYSDYLGEILEDNSSIKTLIKKI